MNTYYFISMNGFLQFASVTCDSLEKAHAELSKDVDRLWILVERDEYFDLYTEAIHDILQ
jgi:hypothetical protein